MVNLLHGSQHEPQDLSANMAINDVGMADGYSGMLSQGCADDFGGLCCAYILIAITVCLSSLITNPLPPPPSQEQSNSRFLTMVSSDPPNPIKPGEKRGTLHLLLKLRRPARTLTFRLSRKSRWRRQPLIEMIPRLLEIIIVIITFLLRRLPRLLVSALLQRA